MEDLLQGNSHKRTKESEETSTGYAKKVLEVLDGEKLRGEPSESSKFNRFKVQRERSEHIRVKWLRRSRFKGFKVQRFYLRPFTKKPTKTADDTRYEQEFTTQAPSIFHIGISQNASANVTTSPADDLKSNILSRPNAEK